MELYDEFFQIVPALNSAGVPYAVVGGIAMAFHDEPRFTRDIDFACAEDGIQSFETVLGKLGYARSTAPWKFPGTEITLHRFLKSSGEDFLTIDVLTSDEARFLEVIANRNSDSSQIGIVHIASKRDLIWLKKLRGSDQDEVDIKRLENDEN